MPGPAVTELEGALQRRPVRRSRQAVRLAVYIQLIFGDALSILVGFSVAKQIRSEEWLMPAGVNLLYVLTGTFLLLAAYAGAYSLETINDIFKNAQRAAFALVNTYLLLFAGLFLTQVGGEVSRLAMATSFVAVAIPLLFIRFATLIWVQRTLSGRLFDTLLILDDAECQGDAQHDSIRAEMNALRPDLNDPTMLERFALITRVYDRVLVACPPERRVPWSIMLKTIDAKGELVMDRDSEIGAIGIDAIGSARTLVVSRGGLSRSDKVKKRVFDLAISIPALLFLAPLLIVTAILIKLDSPGPVFFRQLRVGQNNVPFRIFKFRSMRQEASDEAGRVSTSRDDKRISRFGGFIRRTSIDELPQLFNVLLGEMSIVGPRPHALGSTAEDQLFWQINHRYWERHILKPGITGLAQVRGFRGATERRSDLINRLQADLDYLSEWRLWRDVEILVATLSVIVHPNAY